MRILHLFSNYKWTGPADPAVTLAAAQQDAGHDVTFRSSGYLKGGENYLQQRARRLGIEVVIDLELRKHRTLMQNMGDVRKLTKLLAAEQPDIVHCHQANDYRITRRALARLARSGTPTPPLIRTVYDTDPDQVTGAMAAELRESSAALLVFSQRVIARLIELGVPAQQIQHLNTSVDLERFDPTREMKDLRGDFDFDQDDFLVGIVARVQPQRRFDLLLDTAELLRERCPRFRLIVIGRGSKLEWVARQPARERGLLDQNVFFPGYFYDDEYPLMLRMLDAKLFMVPGTDGTARAVREALATGLPVVCTRRGMLPELVQDGETGYVIDETPEDLAAAIQRLHDDPALRQRLGAAARQYAQENFRIDQQRDTSIDVYEQCLARAQS
ncbi:MAG: glycosyltransferase family 4 protein [Planctomycetota bacterium]